MSIPKGWELVLIVVVVVLLFGAKKLPEAARGLGRSLRIFKAEIKDPSDEEGRDQDGEPTPPAAVNQSPMITATPVAPIAPVAPPAPVVPVQAAQPVVVQPPEQLPAQPPVQQTPTDR